MIYLILILILIDLFNIIVDIWNYAYHFIICLLFHPFAFNSSDSLFLPSPRLIEHFTVEKSFGFAFAISSTIYRNLHICLAGLLLCARSAGWMPENFHFLYFVFFSMFVIHPSVSRSA